MEMTAYYNEIRESVDFASQLFHRIQTDRDCEKQKLYIICDVRELRDIQNFKNRYENPLSSTDVQRSIHSLSIYSNRL